MTTTNTQDATTALLIHLDPTQSMLSGEHGNGVALNCGCGDTFYVDHGDSETGPDGQELRGWNLARRQHADHIRTVAEGLIKQDAQEAAGPVDSDETRAIPSLEAQGLSGGGLADFAREHGLRPDWHEPDNQGVGARVIGTHLDNAMGAKAGRSIDAWDGREYGEFNVILTVEDDDGVPQDAAVVNLANLLAIAALAGDAAPMVE